MLPGKNVFQKYQFLQVSNEQKNPGYLLYIGDEILPNYIRIIS